MYVILQSSTCFEHQHTYLQEDKFYYHIIWYRHSLYSTVQYARREQTLQSLLSSGISYMMHGQKNIKIYVCICILKVYVCLQEAWGSVVVKALRY